LASTTGLDFLYEPLAISPRVSSLSSLSESIPASLEI